jgi:hypothetical protein
MTAFQLVAPEFLTRGAVPVPVASPVEPPLKNAGMTEFHEKLRWQ